MFLTFPLFLFFFLLLIVLPIKWLLSSSTTKNNLPPSPRKLPLIGNLHQLGATPHRSFHALTKKYGPLMLLHLGSVSVLVASSAEAALEIMKTHDLIFADRPRLSIVGKLTYGFKDIGFSPYGEYWRQVKSITVLHLLSTKRVQSFRRQREKGVIHMIDTIGKSCGMVVDISRLVILLTNNIICQVAVGRKYGDKKFVDMLLKFQTLLGAMSVGSYISWLWWVDWFRGLDARADKVARGLDEFLDDVLEEHINKNKVANGDLDDQNDQDKDLVDILLDVQRENANNFKIERDTIKAVILDVFSAGIDTTSTNIQWVLAELIRHPRVMKELQSEVTKAAQGKSMITEDDIQEMHYLKAVIKETLRLHTPLPLLVPRESRKHVKLMGYDIPQGTQVMVNVWAIARDPLLWAEPEKFKPERFLNSSIDYKGLDFEFLPFGAGRRGCPGIQFAIAISELALANIVYKYDLALPNDGRPEEMDMSEVFGLTVHKKTPLLVVPTPRF